MNEAVGLLLVISGSAEAAGLAESDIAAESNVKKREHPLNGEGEGAPAQARNG